MPGKPSKPLSKLMIRLTSRRRMTAMSPCCWWRWRSSCAGPTRTPPSS